MKCDGDGEIILSRSEQKDLLIMSFRYALGRTTYIVADMVDLLERNWECFSPVECRQIKGDIEQAIESRRAGMDIDVKEWHRLLELGDNI